MWENLVNVRSHECDLVITKNGGIVVVLINAFGGTMIKGSHEYHLTFAEISDCEILLEDNGYTIYMLEH